MVKTDGAGTVHVKLNVISRMRKLVGFVQVAFTLRSVLIQAVSMSVEIEAIKCFWSTFEREAIPGKRENKNTTR